MRCRTATEQRCLCQASQLMLGDPSAQRGVTASERGVDQEGHPYV